MSPSVFRLLIGLTILSGVCAGAIDLIPGLVPAGAIEAIEEDEIHVPMAVLVACLALGLLVLLSLIASFAGLLLFKSWSRRLALVTTIASLLFWPLLGATVQSGWASSLLQISAVSWGAVLASAYWSSLAHRFNRQGANNSFKGMPLRGTP